MRKRIFSCLMGISLLVTLLMVGLMSGIFYYYAEQQPYSQLKREGGIIASLLNVADNDKILLSAMSIPSRLTLISSGGTVLYDNQSAEDEMENHLEREEIKAALHDGEGFAKRESSTLFEEQLYYAVRMQDGGFLRISASQKTIGGLMGQWISWIAAGMAIVILLAAILARQLTRRIVSPINAMDFNDPLSSEVYDEFSPVLRRMAEQNQRITSQMEELSARQGELNTLIENMREGLLIMDSKHKVLTMNKSAANILQTPRIADGKTPLFSLNRSEQLRTLVESASRKGSAQTEITVAGQDYSVSASVIAQHQGMVILFQDCTDTQAAEKDRKRFTANVSHELRTPLTAISGYAELMAHNMVQPEDIFTFSQKISAESNRLLKLIEDILHLSKLDEGNAQGHWEPLRLLSVAKAVQESLAELAAEKRVSVQVQGEDATLYGDPMLMEEILRNLMENSIKYNREQGLVIVTIKEKDEETLLCVADTGIGIPKAHQAKVFERFYRVDSSRSKSTGGTGLGLSIVKHGVEYHHASLMLESEEGAGTTIKIRFPKKL